MRIVVIGVGYVGLVSGACFAEMGNTVSCIDINSARIEGLNAGRMPIYEPGIETLVRSGVDAGRLFFDDEYGDAIGDADLVFIAVNTPPREDDSSPDLSAVLDAAGRIAELLKGYTVVATKSTVPVGTCAKLKQFIADRAGGARFDVVSNPEFLRESSAIEDFLHPDRIVIGADTDASRALMRKLYQSFADEGVAILCVNPADAELIKYASNTFLATKIGFINEMADFCEAVGLGLDITAVSKGMGLDPRIGSEFLRAGPSFGGSCIPKDTTGLLLTANEHGTPLSILRSVIQSNEFRKRNLTQKILAACGERSGGTAGILGLTFKANTDDMRYSPSLELVLGLQRAGVSVKAYDPKGMERAKSLLNDVEYCDSAYRVAENTQMLVLHTDWEEFASLDWRRIRDSMQTPVLYDLRNFCDSARMQALGFDYYSVGRAPMRRFS